MKKKDWILAVLILGLALIGLLWQSLSGNRAGAVVRIRIDGEEYGSYSLYEERDIPLDTPYGHNLLRIRDGQAVMIEADCPDGYCMEQGAIDQAQETIICLPHKVVAEVLTSEDGGLDAVVR